MISTMTVLSADCGLSPLTIRVIIHSNGPVADVLFNTFLEFWVSKSERSGAPEERSSQLGLKISPHA
jgi:hypothetical protein